MDALERVVKHYDFIVSRHIMRAGKKCHIRVGNGLKDFIGDIKKNNIIDDIFIYNSKKNLTYSFDDILIENNKICLLFSLINGNEADLTIKDMTNRKKLREATKKKGEGNSYSAHLSINLQPIKPNTYSMLYEVVPNLPVSVVTSLFREAVKKLREKKADCCLHTDQETKKQHQVFYKFEAQGHPSDTLVNMLQKGQISSLQVVDHDGQGSYWDDDKQIEERRKNVTFRIETALINQDTQSKIKALKSLAKTALQKNYDLIRVGYRDIEGSSSTLDVDPKTLDLIVEKTLIKSSSLTNFTNRLPTSFDKINSDIKNRMFLLI